MFNRLRQIFRADLAIDLGTANTVIAVQGQGVTVNEPSVVAVEKESRRVLGNGAAVGKLARQMLGRTPDSIAALRPLQGGVVTDFEICEALLKYLMQKACPNTRGFRPRVVIAVPGGITPVEKRAVFNSAERAGAGRVWLVEESRAAGIGAGLPMSEPMASMICDIGGGTTEVAIFSMADVASSQSVRVAGDAMDAAIVKYFKQHFSLRIGLQTAEQIKLNVGSADELEQELTAEVSGLDTISNVPRKAVVTSEQVREALRDPLETIFETVTTTIEQCQPELVADLADNGMVLSGGGALLRGIDRWFAMRLGIPVRTTEDPLTTVARGTAICLDHLALWKDSLDDGHS